MFCNLVSQFSIWTLQYYAAKITNKYLERSFIFHSLLLYAHVFTCVCVGVRTRLCLYIRGGEVGLRHLPQILLFFETSPLTVFSSHQWNTTSWSADPRDSVPPVLGIQAYTAVLSFSHVYRESKVRSYLLPNSHPVSSFLPFFRINSWQ